MKAKYTIDSLKNYPVFCHEFTNLVLHFKTKVFTWKKEKIITNSKFNFRIKYFWGGSTLAVWKEIIIATFNKDYLYCEDYEWWTKIILADIKVGYHQNRL